MIGRSRGRRELDGETWEARRQYVFGGQYLAEVLIFDKDTDADGDCTEGEGNGSTRYLYCTNNNYNIMALTDSTGAVVERVKYDPYGQPTCTRTSDSDVTTASHFANPWLFQGQRYCSETGLYYFKNRDHSPTLGRFIQRDPAGYVEGMSLCQFVGDMPSSAVDPLGLTPPKKSEICGPDVTEWFLGDLAAHIAYRMANPGLFAFQHQVADLMAYKWMSFDVPGCGTGRCNETVWLAGVCLRKNQLGNIAFAYIATLFPPDKEFFPTPRAAVNYAYNQKGGNTYDPENPNAVNYGAFAGS